MGSFILPLLLATFIHLNFRVHSAQLQDFSNTIEILEKNLISLNDDFALLTSTDVMIQDAGYECEIHNVVTWDGHILPLYRIPPYCPYATNEPVLLMPGVGLSASSFLFVSPERALPYILENENFDVWLGNYRGCEGTGHTNYSRAQRDYWKFGMDEIALIDVPAVLDYILEKTKKKSVSYIGFSLGTTMFYMAMAARPEYNVKIRKFVGLAPGAFVNHTTSVVSILPKFDPHRLLNIFDEKLAGSSGIEKLRPILSIALQFFKVMGMSMESLNLLLPGFVPSHVNTTTWTRLYQGFPKYISGRWVIQADQFIRTGDSKMYDFGPKENYKRYGVQHAPTYNYSNVKTDCLLIHGEADLIFSPPDAVRTFKELGSKNKLLVTVNRSDFSHMDFICGDDVKSLVYDRVVEYLLE